MLQFLLCINIKVKEKGVCFSNISSRLFWAYYSFRTQLCRTLRRTAERCYDHGRIYLLYKGNNNKVIKITLFVLTPNLPSQNNLPAAAANTYRWHCLTTSGLVSVFIAEFFIIAVVFFPSLLSRNHSRKPIGQMKGTF